MASNDINSELDSFREQWRAEVRSKLPGSKNGSQQTVAGPSDTNAQVKTRSKPPKAAEAAKKQAPAAADKETQGEDDEDEYVSKSFDEPEPAASSAPYASGEQSGSDQAEPVSALEHFEQAVEREASGKLGDSLRLYRKAYRVSQPPLRDDPQLTSATVGPPRRPPIPQEALSPSYGP